ncbi:TIGR03986 family CRISPR-associated RAMP protein [Roseospira marina]|uniref:TIGR03986 family CRISPR-associated RAMP protein n=1 Tax=Roseospira marina TaxID=140057 RepID=A0A5M6I6A5_9PROT|nr:TIGR03986 family CRISPR-associated RAMP protein [Roseospira marina]KAA5603776.1 TIGR03986 family CRISPR-associated RAMP protein [Roseospira marina]MBB4316099.1 CRISPR-associated protein (TIGR03986 family) [Roseospira marina]MBB5089265.1 CRISPR-associated protein (TIGR03986 family) [Roseospira marina]
MTRLTAPYNFVPLNDTVVRPDWADKVSMDVPFKDALCGSFDIEITAETPLIVGGRTNAPPEGKDAPSHKERANLFGQDVIPGTSMKGMLRAVVEIATFGRIAPRMDNRRFAVRDLQNAALYTHHMTEMFRPRSRAGWLTLDRTTGAWHLRPCDYSVVRQTTLEALHAARSKGARPLNLGKGKTGSHEKYKAWGTASLDISFTPDAWQARDDWARGRILSRADDVGRGATPGRIVFTGQPQDRDKRGAKRTEFLFHSAAEETLPVPEAARDDFEHIHRDPNTGTPLNEWAYWRPHLLKGEAVPVFYLPDEAGKGIRAMGLAMMFRLANRHSTHDLARQSGDGPDFADLLFGFVAEKGGDRGPALRGRVQIEPAHQTHPGQREGRKKEILLAPKPGYYPAYVAQTHLKTGTPPNAPEVAESTYRSAGKDRPYNAYTTYMDDDARIRGWKRYPVSRNVRTSPPPTLKEGRVVKDASQKVYNTFEPHGPGTRFRARMHLHNLKREELGALVWAITFGGRSDTHRHSLGMAKPLGYGCVKVSIDMASVDIDSVDGEIWDETNAETLFRDCMVAFQAYMNERTPTPWAETSQIRHLLAMADPDHGDALVQDSTLGIMAGPQPFQDAKKAGLVLPPVISEPPGWPKQTPPPRIVEPGERGPGTGNRTARRSAAPAPKATRRGVVDGDPVEVLSIDGNEAQVRFPDGTIEFLDADEIEDLT